MVWNTDQTALYSAVERYNSGLDAASGSSRHERPKKPEKTGQRPENPACEKPQNIPGKQNEFLRSIPRRSPLETIFSDRDMLLIAALIIILMHENADKRLIAALAFVLIM